MTKIIYTATTMVLTQHLVSSEKYNLYDYESTEIFMNWNIGFACLKTDNIIKEACHWRLNTYDHECMIFGRPTKEQFLEFHNRLEYLCELEQESVDSDYNLDYESNAMTVVDVMENLRGYGCWCDINSEFDFTGIGPPANRLDLACKKYVEANRCINSDSITAQSDCPGDFKDYYVAVSTQPEATVEQQCEIFNTFISIQRSWPEELLQCAIRKCIVESKFLRTVIQISTHPDFEFNMEPIRLERNGFFDPDHHCINRVGGKHWRTKQALLLLGRTYRGTSRKEYQDLYDNYDSENVGRFGQPFDDFRDAEHNADSESPLECCGNYPNRYPLYSGMSACCDDEVNPRKFKVMTHECCLNDRGGKSIVPLDTCPFQVV